MKEKKIKEKIPLLPLHPSMLERLFYKADPKARIFELEDSSILDKNLEPNISSSIGKLLEFLSPMFNAKLALDLGTCLGYSAYVLSKIVGSDGRVLSIERNEILAKLARDNIKKAGVDNRVAVIMGEASDTLDGLKGSYDLIVLDVDKNQYVDLLDSLISLLSPGGHLITDDVGFVARDFPAKLRPLSLHMARYVQELLKRKELEHVYIPLGDGVVISRKVGNGDDNQLALFAEKKKKRVVKKAIKKEEAIRRDKENISEDIKESTVKTKEKEETKSDKGLNVPNKEEPQKDVLLSFDRDSIRKRNLSAGRVESLKSKKARNLVQQTVNIREKRKKS